MKIVSAEKSKVILVIDDEPLIADTLKTILELSGHEVYSFVDVDHCINFVGERTKPIDIVISDFKMPKMNGTDLILKIWELKGKVPSIICSGYISKEEEKRALSIGIRAVIHKPIDMDRIDEQLRNIDEDTSKNT